ncbi:hypothetical protein ZEAMMB73_Zm00001d020491 [Zea mays]|uniref:Uncharacterized protein n=1 Tax=Zea mays TaxID=4577 RepID=A0A1D6I4D5_MAIZE|nr:hypothetical protein ZEAMMB73_Zm00001d020491 [Zea mays]
MEGGSGRDKGKEPCIGESSSAAAREWVVTADGTRKQLQGSIDDPWSQGDKWKKQGFKCAYCGCAKESGDKTRLRLHAMMKEKIGGELVRWNSTSDWKNNDWRDEEDHKFTYDCLIDRIWWEKVEMVLKTVTPLYSMLRFADQQKNGTISGFLPKMLSAQAEIFAKLKHDKNVKRDFMKKVNEIIKKRTQYLLSDTLMVAGAALDPKALYTSKLATHHSAILAETTQARMLGWKINRVVMSTRTNQIVLKADVVEIEGRPWCQCVCSCYDSDVEEKWPPEHGTLLDRMITFVGDSDFGKNELIFKCFC